MTQPAKVQEPSMEEILASIRRIIADDEAKPAAVSNSQDDIDAMLAGLDESTSEAEIRPPQPEPEADVFELTDEMAVAEPEPPPPPKPAFQKVEPDDDVEFA